MSVLGTFNGDVQTKEELKAYMRSVINKTALERMYKGEDVSHIADAVILLENTFNQLEEDYGIKVKPNVPTNQAK